MKIYSCIREVLIPPLCSYLLQSLDGNFFTSINVLLFHCDSGRGAPKSFYISCQFTFTKITMTLKAFFLLITIIFYISLSTALKDSENLSRFLQQLNLHHLDLIISDSLLYKTDDILDVEFDTVIQIINNQSKFVAGNQSCKTSSLHILPMESLFEASEGVCHSEPGAFIKNPCETYFAYTTTYPLDDTFKNIECTLHHQPYVFVLVEVNYMNYELLEVQIPSRKMVVIATWNTIEDIK